MGNFTIFYKKAALLTLSFLLSGCGGLLSINAAQNVSNQNLAPGQGPGGPTPPFGLTSRVIVSGLTLPGTLQGNGNTPANLSQTGIFTQIQNLAVKPGVIEFNVNTPLWSNGALKRRWLIVPGTQTITFSANSNWTYPVGSVLMKHFEVKLANGLTKRLETRLLILASANNWEGFLYKWNANDTDATLTSAAVPTENYDIDLSSFNGPSTQTITYRYPVGQCMVCHNSALGPLGAHTAQLNGAFQYGPVSDNQIRSLNNIGMFGSSASASLTSYNQSRKIFNNVSFWPSLTDTAETLDKRVRGHLAANCSACHSPTGAAAGVGMDLRFDTPLAMTNTLGPANNNRLVPGSPATSFIFNRVGGFGQPTTMPPVGIVGNQVGEPDFVTNPTVGLLGDWINSLP